MAAVIGSLRAELTATIAQFQRDLGKAADTVRGLQKEFSNVGRDFQNTGRQLQNVGMALTKTITLPLVAFGAASAKAAIDFESAFANVSKTVDGVSDSSGTLTATGKALAQTFRDMAKTIPATTQELSAIAALGGQMGVPVQQLEKFTKNVAALSVAVDGLTAEEAAVGLASIGNATGTGTQNIQQMASALVHLGNNSNATEAQILEFTKRLVGAGTSVGMTVPEIMALGTTMANVGINAEAGGTAMSTVINKISNAVSQGGEALTEFARVADMSVEEFAATWKTKPIVAMQAFIDGLGTMKARGVDLNLTMGELGTEGIRVQDTLKRVSGATGDVAKNLKLANEGFSAADKHLAEAEKKYATTANQLKILGNRIYDVRITLGNAMIPAIKAAIDWIEKLLPVVDRLANAFAALPGEIQAAFLVIGGLVAALGPVIFIAGQLVSSMGTLATAFGKGGVGSKALTAALSGLSQAFGALVPWLTTAGRLLLTFVNPVSATVAGIGLLTVAFLKWTGTLDDAIQIVQDLGRILLYIGGDVLDRVWKGITRIADYIGGVFVSTLKGLGGIAATVFGGLVTWLKDMIPQWVVALGDKIGVIASATKQAVIGAKDSLHEYAEAARSTATSVAGAFEQAFKKAPKLRVGAGPQVLDATQALALLTQQLEEVRRADAEAAGGFGFSDTLKGFQREIDNLKPALREDLIAALKSGVFEMEELKKRSGLTEGAIKLFKDTLDDTGKSVKDLTELQDRLFSRSAITNATDMVRALGSVENVSKLTAAAQKQLHDTIGDAIETYRALGQAVPPVLQEIYDRTIPLTRFAQTLRPPPGLQGLTKTFIAFGDVLEDGSVYARDFSYELTVGTIALDEYGRVIPTKVIPPLKGLQIEFEKVKTIAEEMAEGIKKAFAGLPDLLKQAFTGGGGLMGALKAFGVQVAEAVTKPLMQSLSNVFAKFGSRLADLVKLGGSAAGAIGQTAAAAVPVIKDTAINVGAGTGAAAAGGFGFGMSAAQAIPVYGAVAAGIYGIVKGFQALKAQKAHMEANRLRDAFFQTEGGLQRLNPIVLEMTGNLDAVQKVFDAKNPEQFQAAVANLTPIIEAYNEKWAEQQQLFEGLQGEVATLGETLGGLTTITPEVQAALEAVFDETTTEGYLAAIANLNGELDKQKQAYDEVKGALDKYGISFKDAGKKFQQSNINERAKELIGDFLKLREVGVPIPSIIGGMSKNLQQFVLDAKKAGVEVPESMRPIIQHAIDEGRIFDENGKKIGKMEELGLTFGTTMQDTMKKVDESMGKLETVLADLAKWLKEKMPAAAKEGAEKVNRELDKIEDVDVDVNVRNKTPGGETTDGITSPEGFQHGSHGVRDFGSGTLAVLHGREAVIPEADLLRAASASSPSPVYVSMTINVDGVFSEGDLVQTIQRRVEPIIRQTWEDNVNGSRTNAQDILGVP